MDLNNTIIPTSRLLLVTIKEEHAEATTVAMAQDRQAKRTPSQAVLFGCLTVFVAVLLYWQSTSEDNVADLNVAPEVPAAVEESKIEQRAEAAEVETVEEEIPTQDLKVAEVVVEELPATDPAPVVTPVAEEKPVVDIKEFEAGLQDVSLGLPASVTIHAKQETWVQIGDGKTLPIISKVMLPGEVFRVPQSDKELKLLAECFCRETVQNWVQA